MLRLPPDLQRKVWGWPDKCLPHFLHTLIHPLAHISSHSLTSLGICAFISSFVHLFLNLPTHFFIYLFVHSSTCSVIYSLLGSVAYLATHSHSHSIGLRLECGVLTKWSRNCPCLNKLQDTELWQTPSVPQGCPASLLLPSPSWYRGLCLVSLLYILLACGQLACPSSHMDLGSGPATVWGAQPSSIPTASLVKPHDPHLFLPYGMGVLICICSHNWFEGAQAQRGALCVASQERGLRLKVGPSL